MLPCADMLYVHTVNVEDGLRSISVEKFRQEGPATRNRVVRGDFFSSSHGAVAHAEWSVGIRERRAFEICPW